MFSVLLTEFTLTTTKNLKNNNNNNNSAFKFYSTTIHVAKIKL